MQVSVYIATSLDGFIARENGDLDWLDEAAAAVPESEDMGYKAFMDSVDVLIMGRNTYEKVLSFDVDWPYEKHVIVLSSRELTVPEYLFGKVSHSRETPEKLIARLKSQGVKRAYLDGGLTVQSFLSAGLVDDLCISVAPVLLGKGKRLFGDSPTTKLKLLNSTSYEFGFVQSTYEVVK